MEDYQVRAVQGEKLIGYKTPEEEVHMTSKINLALERKRKVKVLHKTELENKFKIQMLHRL